MAFYFPLKKILFNPPLAHGWRRDLKGAKFLLLQRRIGPYPIDCRASMPLGEDKTLFLYVHNKFTAPLMQNRTKFDF